MAVIREPLIPTLIENTIMEKIVINGVLEQYGIKAIEGYVLHDGRESEIIYDDDLNDTGERLPKFAIGDTTVRWDYDFDNRVNGMHTYVDENGMTINVPVQKVGAFEFYAVPESIVPTAQIYGGGNDHEVM